MSPHADITRAFGGAPPLVDVTDDAGLTLEFEKSGRSVLFAIPREADVRYFLARDDAGFRKAGVVTLGVAIVGLARWLDRGAPFPVEGVVVGSGVGFEAAP